MNHTSQTFFTRANTGLSENYEMLKEEHEVAVLGTPQSSAPVTSTVINIRSDTSVPDHVVWSLFNTLFMNWCCLGFIAFAYSVKGQEDGGRRDWGPGLCLHRQVPEHLRSHHQHHKDRDSHRPFHHFLRCNLRSISQIIQNLGGHQRCPWSPPCTTGPAPWGCGPVPGLHAFIL
ncbi:uncharacterized protein LOC134375744 isoform X1 [Cynocephalus volans]|uniref:uncharacterized protein LOC134375744 isoform X1 n=1 Tax=Cynocephalus volans TaxID=110931 RepID=UPI002FCC1DC6